MQTSHISGSRLKQLREISGLSQYELSIRAGIPRDKVSRVECGYVELELDECVRAESAISVAVTEKQQRLSSALAIQVEATA